MWMVTELEISSIRIILDDSVRSLGVHIVYGIVSGVTVEKDRVDIREYAERLAKKLVAEYSVERLREHPIIRAYRDFYWRLGIDPTKTRPSSEALLRRVLRTRTIPLINNVVDSGNFASLETLVPIGLYDIDRIKGQLRLRLSREGEVFDPIGGSRELLSEGLPVLADDEKIIHLYPHRDSRHTMIRPSTKNVLVVACGVPNVPSTLIREAASKTIEYILRFAGGIQVGELIYER